MLTDPRCADIFKRSETFAQSMRRGVRTEDANTAAALEGKIVWLRELPDRDMLLVLIDAGDGGPYRRILAMKSTEVSVGDVVSTTPYAKGLTLSNITQQASQGLRLRGL